MHFHPTPLGTSHPARALVPLALLLPLALVAALCVPAPSVALLTLPALIVLSQPRGLSSAPVTHAPRSHAPDDVLTHPP